MSPSLIRTFLVLLVPACAEASLPETPKGSAPDHPDAGSEPVNLAAIGSQRLDGLRGAEARAVCEEDQRRSDPCMAIALAHYDVATCAATLESCRSSRPANSTALDCERHTYGAPGSCAVSVDEYFTCIDAWNAVYTCENARYFIGTPEPCEKAVEQCPALGPVLYRGGQSPPCDPFTGVETPDTNDDIVGSDGCRPLPTRMVVLGDSIADCYVAPPEECAAYLIADDLRTYAPGLSFEMHAKGGSVTADLPAQARRVQGGPGHVVVWIWAIGNDFLLLLPPDREKVGDFEGWTAAWKEVFDYFTDSARFPDGVTFLLNSQFSLGDECTTGDEAKLEALLRETNRRLFLDVAEARSDTIAIDQYPDWLGHGAQANVKGCPHCGLDNSKWHIDNKHPDVRGHTHIAEKWSRAFEQMYGATCQR